MAMMTIVTTTPTPVKVRREKGQKVSRREMATQQQQPLDASTPEDENLFINASDGLSNEHPALPSAYADSDNEDHNLGGGAGDENDLLEDLPTSIIVTQIHSEVFTSEELKSRMEDLFRTISDKATFQWLKSFRRLRVNYDSALAAANARIQLHQYPFGKSVITCYLAQPVTPVSNTNLKPPALTKQFLISPPASPPAGWEPAEENEPLRFETVGLSSISWWRNRKAARHSEGTEQKSGNLEVAIKILELDGENQGEAFEHRHD
ncbi:nebula [Culex quinquefasciatus]|uniref:Nebula n=1 Tax=Culex quinquefasciatus TaxID=7176 RepID=B0X638_CULQU|nr:nebula [Culex quinquefasciatus]|eukprot:XP_001865110.1 nebula [Culex quinquefasciatus]